MSQRVSGYARKRNDRYFTPDWCTEAVLPFLRIRPPGPVHEPAAGNDAIVKVLRRAKYKVTSADIVRGTDFLRTRKARTVILTNPPYGLAEEFITHALGLTTPGGVVAMLLRTDYDHAAGRRYLFTHPFAMKVVLLRRIRWFPKSKGSPSFNHAWFIWDWEHKGPPIIRYAA